MELFEKPQVNVLIVTHSLPLLQLHHLYASIIHNAGIKGSTTSLQLHFDKAGQQYPPELISRPVPLRTPALRLLFWMEALCALKRYFMWQKRE